MFDRFQLRPQWSNRLDADYVVRWAALRRDRDHAGYYNLVHQQELTRLREERTATEQVRPQSTIGVLSRIAARLGIGKADRERD